MSPNRVQSRTPSQGSGGRGARNRFRPAIGAAYGMPRQRWVPPARSPRTRPYFVSTIG